MSEQEMRKLKVSLQRTATGHHGPKNVYQWRWVAKSQNGRPMAFGGWRNMRSTAINSFNNFFDGEYDIQRDYSDPETL